MNDRLVMLLLIVFVIVVLILMCSFVIVGSIVGPR
jgi:hypothetical protein